MAKKASVQDLSQMLTDSVCMYKNKPYYILGIGRDYMARAFDILAQREVLIACDETTFTAPTTRLGFVNVKGYAVYASRIPIRRYKVGLSAENTKFAFLDYPYKDAAKLSIYLGDLQRVELADCIMGRYPTIEEAFKRFDQGANSSRLVAFDKQFAIDYRGYIFYKERAVGRVAQVPTSVADIIFDPDFTHLTTLLGKKYETL